MNFPLKKKQLRYRERNREERIQCYQLSLEILSKNSEEDELQPLLLLITINSFYNMYFYLQTS